MCRTLWGMSCLGSCPLSSYSDPPPPPGIACRRQWQPTPVHLPGKSHGWRSLVGCSPWGRKESGTTERLHFHFSLLCFGEGNGNPLENPRDSRAWWAAVSGVTQSRTQLKRLSSSSSSFCSYASRNLSLFLSFSFVKRGNHICYPSYETKVQHNKVVFS